VNTLLSACFYLKKFIGMKMTAILQVQTLRVFGADLKMTSKNFTLSSQRKLKHK